MATIGKREQQTHDTTAVEIGVVSAMMGSVAVKQVDVFTDERFTGNPVAVILDGTGLTTDQMQQIAN